MAVMRHFVFWGLKAFKPWKLGFDCFFSLMHYHLKKKKAVRKEQRESHNLCCACHCICFIN